MDEEPEEAKTVREPGEITRKLAERGGWGEVLGDLAPMVIDDLRRLARHYIAGEGRFQTLQPTELVNEVYLRFAAGRSERPRNRKEFFCFASRLIREILLDRARARLAERRGGRVHKVALDEALGVARQTEPGPEVLLAIGEVLERLEQAEPRQAHLVELRFFTGLTLEQAAAVLEISLATAERDWSAARRWLARSLAAQGEPEGTARSSAR